MCASVYNEDFLSYFQTLCHSSSRDFEDEGRGLFPTRYSKNSKLRSLLEYQKPILDLVHEMR